MHMHGNDLENEDLHTLVCQVEVSLGIQNCQLHNNVINTRPVRAQKTTKMIYMNIYSCCLNYGSAAD